MNEKLKEALKECIDFIEGLKDTEYHSQGMGCGLEDRGITDRYEAMHHGWDEALVRAHDSAPALSYLRAILSQPSQQSGGVVPSVEDLFETFINGQGEPYRSIMRRKFPFTVEDGIEAIHAHLAAQQPPRVDLSGVQRIGFSVDLQPWHRNFSEPLVIEIPDKNGQYVRFSDLEKLLALPQTEKGGKDLLVREIDEYLHGNDVEYMNPKLSNDGRGSRAHQMEIAEGIADVIMRLSPPQDAGKVKP